MRDEGCGFSGVASSFPIDAVERTGYGNREMHCVDHAKDDEQIVIKVKQAFDSGANGWRGAQRFDPEQQRGMAHAAESRPQVT
ncbi:hypothetical protein L3V59_23620 [Burkholderia aenigmatica]|uniref:hypothetical protein n=1 Tax=Burkholderia TaxID=32008 RepID=UPI0015835931|nr:MULTISPECIES: hypothetical protein [Burkholderia]MCA8293280.1 hypothetical protein [Burkholderia sp. AU30198]UKD15922.1 hypothetical protein L3V59_23620 [Burkholderia aenigmatica]